MQGFLGVQEDHGKHGEVQLVDGEELSWEDVAAVAEDRQRRHQRVVQIHHGCGMNQRQGQGR